MKNKILIFITASIFFGASLYQVSADIGGGGISTAPVGVGSTSITTLGTVTAGTWNGTKIGIGYGGTNATNATDARTNLGLAIGSDVQAYDADLDTWSGITPSTDVQAFLGAANDTAARTELGLGSLATQNADNAIVTNLTANVIKTDTSADATLSGTPIIITVYDAASNTPYYFKAYPTK